MLRSTKSIEYWQDCLSVEGRPPANRRDWHNFCSCDLDVDRMILT